MELTLPTIRDLSVTTNKNVERTHPSNPKTFKDIDESKKLVTPRLRFGETVDAGAYSTEDPPLNLPLTRQQTTV